MHARHAHGTHVYICSRVFVPPQIQVKTLIISNYEKYSSTTKDFVLLGATSFPTQTWVNLGDFVANFSTGSQKFILPADQRSLARYLKIIFNTFHGDEHYCTLSQVKVHGSTVHEFLAEEWVESNKEQEEMMAAVIKADEGLADEGLAEDAQPDDQVEEVPAPPDEQEEAVEEVPHPDEQPPVEDSPSPPEPVADEPETDPSSDPSLPPSPSSGPASLADEPSDDPSSPPPAVEEAPEPPTVPETIQLPPPDPVPEATPENGAPVPAQLTPDPPTSEKSGERANRANARPVAQKIATNGLKRAIRD